MEPGGVLLDRYEVVRELGAGGAGELLLVRDRKDDLAACALKVLRPRIRDPLLAPLFRNEFLLLSDLRHESIVAVREFGVLESGEPYFTMDYVAGETCRAFVEADRLEAAEYVDLAAGLVRALAHVHTRGLLHRDVKPENVVMCRSENRLLPVLVDFGLAVTSAASRPGEASGTLPYIAPEVIAGGAADERADLFSLGMLLHEVCTGARPAERDDLIRSPTRFLAPERVRTVLRKKAREAVPRRYEDFVVRLLDPTPAGRYPSAHDALRELARIYGDELVGAPIDVAARPSLAEAPLVGRGPILDALMRRVDAMREGSLLEPLAVVAGKAGLGTTRLLAALRNHASAAGCPVLAGRSLLELVAELAAHPVLGGDAPGPAEGPTELLFRADTLLHAAPQTEAPVLILDDVHRLDDGECAALRSWIAALEGTPGRARMLLVLGGRNEGEGPGVDLLQTAGRSVPVEWRDLAPLATADVRAALVAVLGRPRVPAPVVQALHRACDGSPLLFTELLRLLVSEGVLGFEEGEPVLHAEKLGTLVLPRSVVEASRARASRCGPGARAALARLALVDRPLPFEAAHALAGDELRPLLRDGFLRRDRGRIGFPNELARQAADELAGTKRRRALESAADAIAAIEPAAAAMLLVGAGALDRARGIGRPAAAALLKERRLEEARRLLDALAGDGADEETVRLLVEVLYESGHSDRAARLGTALLETRRDVETLLLACSALREARRPQEALDLLRRFDLESAGETAARIANAKAGILASLKRFDEALLESGRAEAAAGSLLGLGGNIARARSNILREVGRLAGARRIETAIIEAQEISPQARQSALVNRAYLHLFRGEPLDALRDQRAALAIARGTGRAVAEARALAGIARTLAGLGRPESAIRRLERARPLLERSMRLPELEEALFAEAEALILAGRPTEAERRLARAASLPGARTDRENRARLLHLSGSPAEAARVLQEGAVEGVAPGAPELLARITGALSDVEAVEESWRAALRTVRRDRWRLRMAAIRVGLAECAALRGAWRLAERLLDRGRAATLRWKTPDRARALLVRAGAALHRNEPGAAGRHLEEAVAVANRVQEAPLRAEVYSSVASFLEEEPLQRHLRQPTVGAAAHLLEAARDLWSLYGNEAMLRKVELHLSELPRPGGDPLSGPDADRLVKVLHVAREMNREFDRDRLLGLILDRAIELTGAERGFVILLKEGREAVHLARNFDRESLPEPENKVSTQIVKEVVGTGRIIRSEDAGHDTRFDESLSVRNLRLRSIVAVPFRSQGKTVGALYLDNRFRTGTFTEREERLLELFADQAVAAIDKAELIRDLEGKSKELEELYKEQKAELKRQGRELAGARREIRKHRTARGWGFDRIVARSVAMQAVVREAKRYAVSDLAVLLTGENGTGKEMLARAIHYASRRQSMPFLAVNCAAFPEALLEAELFGHVRGSFTGADRDRAGLFEEANGGTLLLDEIGDMAMPMQVRLLRTIELGEVKRVGESRTRTVDVRVVAATNADLEDLIRNGKFREDLYYRLSGVVLRIPPLRERLEDVEPLAYAFVEEAGRIEGRPSLGISNEAIARLESYAWSGNVRELRNVIMRAAVSTEADLIGPDDITFDVRSSALPGFDPSQAERIVAELDSRGFALNERQQAGVARVLARGKMTFGEYRQLFRVSKSTTARDLDSLAEADILEKRGKTRALLYLAGPKLREVARKIAGP